MSFEATPARGQITGFSACRIEPGFTGAFVIDDLVKPKDAYSTAKRLALNNRFNNTMRSRLALETLPMVIIMSDLSGQSPIDVNLTDDEIDKFKGRFNNEF